MSIYDKASLIQIPSGYKAGKLYSVIPNSGAGDFTHTRNAAATRVNSQGLIETVETRVPRLDYPFIDGVVQDCPSLLLEPTRRNLFFNSEDFTNASWNKTRTTITGNQATAPDGSNNADLLTGDGTGTSYIFDGVFLYSATYYVSIFVKNINGNDFTIQNFSQSGTAVFDLTDGTVTSTSGTLSDAKIEQYPNNWYRVSAKITSTLGGANANIGYGVKNYNGDQFYIWGAQIEDNASGGSVSYISSYISTNGSSVTRLVDSCEVTDGLENIIGQTEGTFFIDFEYLYETTASSSTDSLRDVFHIGTTSDLSEGITFDNYRSGFRVFVLMSTGNLSLGNTTAGSSQPNTRYKLAIKYKTGDCKAYLNGNLLGSSTGTVNFASVLNGIFFSYADTNRILKNQKKVYGLMMFKEALSDSELETITSYSSFNSMATALGYKII